MKLIPFHSKNTCSSTTYPQAAAFLVEKQKIDFFQLKTHLAKALPNSQKAPSIEKEKFFQEKLQCKVEKHRKKNKHAKAHLKY